MAQYWLLKTEPDTYSFDDLEKDKKTNWNGVRNYQARNFLREIKKNDLALIYHSGKDKCVIGVSQISKPAYPDLDPQKKGDWVQVDLKVHERLKSSVSLAKIKATPTLKDLPLIKQSRLSVMPITEKHFKEIIKLGKSS